jgi:predicted nucleic acid-binding protein
MSRVYWDSSALMLALVDGELRGRLDRKTAVTRPHSLAEVFSALTGKQGPQRVSADDAARQLAELAQEVSFVDLTAAEILDAIRKAQKRGVRGGRVHDYLHATAAQKDGAKQLFTADENDFAGLADGLEVVAV